MRRLLLLVALIPVLAWAQFSGAPVQSVAGKTGKVTLTASDVGLGTSSTPTFAGVNLNGLVSATATNTSATSGNVNFFSGVNFASPASTSTAVYSGGLNEITSNGAASIVSPGHSIAGLNYNHVQKTQDLAIGAEGKLTVDVTGVTLTSGASVHAGLADVVSGSTITNMTLVNTVVTANHGTISTLKGVDFGITSSALIGNVFAYNAQDLTTLLATNYGGFRCQITATAAHYCIYADGDGQNYLKGNTYIGAATGVDNGSGAKLQVTGTSTTSVHALSVGSAPTISSGCGTSPSIAGRDEASTITVGTGGSATSCTIAFSTSFTTNAPPCVPISSADTGLLMTTATNGFTVSKATALTAGSKIQVLCHGWL